MTLPEILCTKSNFCSADKATLIKFIQERMDSTSTGSDMWFNNSLKLLNLVVEINILERTYNHGSTSPDVLIQTMSLDELERFSAEGYIENLNESSGYLKEEILNYLNFLPDYSVDKQGKQSIKTQEQHGFLVMQIQKALNQLDMQFKSE